MRSDHSIAMLCGNLEVSPSGFYDWDQRRQRPGARSLEDQALVGLASNPAQSSGVIVHMPRGALVVPVPMVSVIRWIDTWPSWKR